VYLLVFCATIGLGRALCVSKSLSYHRHWIPTIVPIIGDWRSVATMMSQRSRVLSAERRVAGTGIHGSWSAPPQRPGQS